MWWLGGGGSWLVQRECGAASGVGEVLERRVLRAEGAAAPTDREVAQVRHENA